MESKIYLTGDCHGEFSKLQWFAEDEKDLTKDDYVIVLGDMGILWSTQDNPLEKKDIEMLENLPFTTLFVLGNHENYDKWGDLDSYPIEEWHGGLVQKLAPSVIRLRNGEIFNICGKQFFAMGGASSHDIKDGILKKEDFDDEEEFFNTWREWSKNLFKQFRVEHYSWWKEEVPNQEQRNYAKHNLALNDNKVDYIISHEMPSSFVTLLGCGYYKPTEYSKWLEEEIRQKIKYNHWYGGHYHDNKDITEKETILYDEIRRIA